jgi:MYXO-CTERM domain-containing protein
MYTKPIQSGATMSTILRLSATLIATSVFVASGTAFAAPSGWTCDDAKYGDEVCDCGCGAEDSDCPAGTFEVCERSGCRSGQVPWEHSPASCMTSACGDGWADVLAGEFCDDGAALASGGCSADCSAINDGYECGERAEKCWLLPDEPEEEPGAADAGAADADGTPDAGGSDAASGGDTASANDSAATESDDSSGCSAAPPSGLVPALWALIGLVLAGRRREAGA